MKLDYPKFIIVKQRAFTHIVCFVNGVDDAFLSFLKCHA